MSDVSLIRKQGRPTKLVQATRERLVKAIAEGNYYDDACAYAGISYKAFRDWMVAGEAKKGPLFIQLFQEVKKAEADAVIRMTGQWQQAMTIPGNWQAIATFLERRYPEKWGRRTIEVTGKGGGPLQHQVVMVTPDAVAAALKILADLGVHLDGRVDGADGNGNNPALLPTYPDT